MPRRARTKPATASPLRRAADVLALGPDCTLREAQRLKQQLVQAVATSPRIIEGSGVERIDAAGLQLLVAFALREKLAGRSLRWKGVSETLRSTSARAGLLDILDLDAGPETEPAP